MCVYVKDMLQRQPSQNPAGFLLAAGEKELSNSIRPAPCDSKYNCDPEDDARLLKPAELGHATTNPYFE